MTDYNPTPPPKDRDPNAYQRNMDSDRSGRGLTLIVGILVAIAVAAGLLFFNTRGSERVEQAQVPARERTVTPAPVTNPATSPATNPAPPAATPAPPPADTTR